MSSQNTNVAAVSVNHFGDLHNWRNVRVVHNVGHDVACERRAHSGIEYVH